MADLATILQQLGYSAYQGQFTGAQIDTYLAIGLTEDSSNPGCFYRYNNGVKEWLNPPYANGVEYTVMNRHGGSPLKVMSKNLGQLTDGAIETITVSGVTNIFDYAARVGTTPLPHIENKDLADASSAFISVSRYSSTEIRVTYYAGSNMSGVGNVIVRLTWN